MFTFTQGPAVEHDGFLMWVAGDGEVLGGWDNGPLNTVRLLLRYSSEIRILCP